MFRNIVNGLAILCLAGCSGSGGGSTPATSNQYPWNSFSVTTANDLPTCAGDIVGRLYYIESTSLFQVCKSTGWTTINVKGQDGTNGSNGTNGTNGLTISSIKYCKKTSGSITFDHNIVTYSTGDKWVYCAISNALDTFSASVMYLAAQNGATNESCIIVYDLDSASSGWWNFSLSGTTRTAVYSDAASASNGTTLTFATSDCSTVP